MSRPRKDGGGLRTACLVVLLLAGCHHIPLRQPVREVPPLPEEIRRRFQPAGPPRDFTLELVDSGSGYTRFRFQFQCPAFADRPVKEVSGEYFRASAATPSSPAPLMQNSPILGGALDDYLTCRIFGRWAAREGISSFFIHQEDLILSPDRSGADLERRLIEMTIENVHAIDCLVRLPEVDARRIGSFGISLGAIKNVLLIAVDGRLQANVLCLAGGDLARIIDASRESLVVRYLVEREAREKMTRRAIIEDLRRSIHSDPMHLAPYVDPRRVLMYLGSIDDKVPYATGLALHRALGGPELQIYPLGHYTGMLAAPRAASMGFAWMKKTFQEAEKRPQASSSGSGAPPAGSKAAAGITAATSPSAGGKSGGAPDRTRGG